jgi:hypothetical protein
VNADLEALNHGFPCRFSTDNRSVYQKTTNSARVNIVTICSCERRANALFGGAVLDQTGDLMMAARRKISRREWTKSDVRQLKSLAKKVPASQIARKLRRSEGAVRQKAFVLGTSLGTRKRRRRK